VSDEAFSYLIAFGSSEVVRSSALHLKDSKQLLGSDALLHSAHHAPQTLQ
jgi:hypothetical protein